MSLVRITGRIFPETAKIEFIVHEPIKTYNASLDLHCSMLPEIRGNMVTINCELNHFDENEHFVALFTLAHDTVRTFLDLLSFSRGFAFTLVFDRVERSDGPTGPISFHDPGLEAHAASVSRAEDFTRIMGFLLENPEIQLAIRDLADSLSSLHAAPINCARAVEAICSQFVPVGRKREDGWRAMRDALNIGRDFLVSITDISKGPRHGSNRKIAGEPINLVGYRSWMVMNRYFEYIKRGRPLREPLFPLLD